MNLFFCDWPRLISPSHNCHQNYPSLNCQVNRPEIGRVQWDIKNTIYSTLSEFLLRYLVIRNSDLVYLFFLGYTTKQLFANWSLTHLKYDTYAIYTICIHKLFILTNARKENWSGTLFLILKPAYFLFLIVLQCISNKKSNINCIL